MLNRHINPTYLLAWLLTLVGGLMVGACSSAASDEPQPGPDSSREIVGTIGLYLNIDGPASTSRTPGDGPEGNESYNPGAGYENYINPNGKDVRVYVYTPGAAGTNAVDRLYKEITDFTIVPYSFNEISRFYYLTFPVDLEFKTKFENKEIKLVMLANWHEEYPENLAEGSTIDDLVKDSKAIMKMMPFGPTVQSDNLIPLFGVKRFNVGQLVPDMVKWLGDLSLLRAMAKIEVYDAELTAMPIKSVTLTRHNTHLYKAPHGILEEKQYVTGSYYSDYGKGPSVPEGHESVNIVNLQKDEKGHFVIYVPEFRNLDKDENSRARLQIEYAGEEPNYIDFKYYSGIDKDKHFDILRNHWYKFEVRKNMPPIVQVVPYMEVSLDPLYGLLIGKDYVPILSDDETVLYWYDKVTGKYFGPDKITEITEPPFLTVDPATGWTIIRDVDTDVVIGYYNPENGKYYDLDKTTEIPAPR